MWLTTILVFSLFCGGSLGCLCALDGKSIDCLNDDNVTPDELINICDSNEMVESVSIGFSVYCHSGIKTTFRNLENLYVGGGAGASCECYFRILCLIDVAGCVCMETTSVTGPVTTDHRPETTHPTEPAGNSETKNAGVVIIFSSVLIVLVLVFAISIFVAYQYCYLKLWTELHSQRDSLIERATDSANSDDSGQTPMGHVFGADDIEGTMGLTPPVDAGGSTAGSNYPADALIGDLPGLDTSGSSQLHDDSGVSDKSVIFQKKTNIAVDGIDNGGFANTPQSELKLIVNSETTDRSKKLAKPVSMSS